MHRQVRNSRLFDFKHNDGQDQFFKEQEAGLIADYHDPTGDTTLNNYLGGVYSHLTNKQMEMFSAMCLAPNDTNPNQVKTSIDYILTHPNASHKQMSAFVTKQYGGNTPWQTKELGFLNDAHNSTNDKSAQNGSLYTELQKQINSHSFHTHSDNTYINQGISDIQGNWDSLQHLTEYGLIAGTLIVAVLSGFKIWGSKSTAEGEAAELTKLSNGLGEYIQSANKQVRIKILEDLLGHVVKAEEYDKVDTSNELLTYGVIAVLICAFAGLLYASHKNKLNMKSIESGLIQTYYQIKKGLNGAKKSAKQVTKEFKNSQGSNESKKSRKAKKSR